MIKKSLKQIQIEEAREEQRREKGERTILTNPSYIFETHLFFAEHFLLGAN